MVHAIPTNAASPSSGVIDHICTVRCSSPYATRIRVWASVDGVPNLMLRFLLPSGTVIGQSGRLRGLRMNRNPALLPEIARNSSPPVPADQVRLWKCDDMRDDEHLRWDPIIPGRPAVPPVVNPLSFFPITVTVAAGSLWRSGRRLIRVTATSGSDLDARLKVDVVENGLRKSAAKRITVRTLLSKYSPA